MNLEDSGIMEEKSVNVLDEALIGTKIINTLAIILVFLYTLGTYLAYSIIGNLNIWNLF